MNKEYEFLKTMLSFSISGVLHIFKVFPIQRNKILLYPFNGHYYCNLKYIDEKSGKNIYQSYVYGKHTTLKTVLIRQA